MHSALFVEELLFRIFDDPILASEPLHDPTYTAESSSEHYYLRRYPLLSLALTCKTFSDPALRLLWKQIDGIDQLLTTMSDDIIKIVDPSLVGAFSQDREDSDAAWYDEWEQLSDEEWQRHFFRVPGERPGKQRPSRKYMILKRLPVEEDWEPFDRYAALVREFKNRNSYATGDQLKLARNVYEALLDRYASKGTPLLPDLRSLTCTGRQLRYSCSLLGPHLHTLCLPQSSFYNGAPYEKELQAFLQIVRSNPPPLKSVQLDYVASAQIGQLFADLVIELHRRGEGLNRVRAHPAHGLPLQALKVLLSEKRVQEIKVKVGQFDLDQVLDASPLRPRKDLRILHIYSIKPVKGVANKMHMELSFFQEFFRRLHAPNLASFSFTGGPFHPSADDVRAMFTSLKQTNAFATASPDIFSPTISTSPVIRSDYNGVAIELSHHICTFANSFHLLCEPISSTDSTTRFAHLQILDLHRVLVDLTDDEIGTLSSSLPRLTSFQVETSSEGRTGQSRTTLIGIWLIVKNCRSIRSVGIWLNAVLNWAHFAIVTGLVVPNDAAGRKILLSDARNMNLKDLMVGNSDIEDSDTVINFLAAACPHVVNLNFHNSRDPTRSEQLWRDVRFGWPSLGR